MAFPSNCEGKIINVSRSNGCSLTAASFLGMTPNDFEAQGMKEVGMDKVYANLQEAKLCGYVEGTLTMLLNGRISGIKGALQRTSLPGSESIILPFMTRRQRRNISSEFWKVASGTPNPRAGTGDVPASAWDVVVQNNPSTYASALLELDRYFLAGKTFFVEYANASTKAAYRLQYKIIGAGTIGSVTKVTVAPNYSEAGWAALSAADKLPYQIGGVSGGNAVAGTIAYLGANSVSDFESWNGQDPVENPNSFLNWFWQTSRYVNEYTDAYLKAMNNPLASNYFKMFQELTLARQKVEQKRKFDRDMLNSVFYGQRINEKQTVEGYRNLPIVEDSNQPGCVLEYKANALGIMTQLSDCSRVHDNQGLALDFDVVCEKLLNVKRAREADGGEIETVDLMTDRWTAGIIQDMFISYYKKKHGVVSNRNYQPDQALTFENQVKLNYNRYQLPPEFGGFNIAVFHHPFFEAKLNAAAGADHARAMWAIDWTDIELGIGATNSVVRQTDVNDKLYQYQMKVNMKHVTMNSITWSLIMEDANRHYIETNFSPACPSITVSGCDVSPAAS